MSLRDRLLARTGGDLADEALEASCQACETPGMLAFYEAVAVPTQSCVLLDSPEEATAYPTGEILLAFCERCGFIQNTRFDLSLVNYSQPTEESQAFSPTFTEFASWLVEELVHRYQLVGRTILEIGCGKGDFLVMLAEAGIARGLGIDPGYLPDRLVSPSKSVEFRREWYGPGHTGLTADLIITRHLMEHIPNVAEFLSWLRDSAGHTPGASVFTEVPDVERVLVEGAFWDVYYEHCSYFSLGSLARSLRRAGMGVHWLQRGFNDQYLLAGARIGDRARVLENEDTPAELAKQVEGFVDSVTDQRLRWRELIEATFSQDGSIVLWGGGSKAVAFLTTVGLRDAVVVDINPAKQGTFLPGSGAPIFDPAELRERDVSLVVVMNPIYLAEIESQLEDMGVDSSVVALGNEFVPPSPALS